LCGIVAPFFRRWAATAFQAPESDFEDLVVIDVVFFVRGQVRLKPPHVAS
jgi:hypothetical protein